jgi:hypothetical protein
LVSMSFVSLVGLIMSRSLRLSLSALLISVVQGVAAEPTAEEILARLRNRREHVENLALEARWTEFVDGEPVAIERAVIHKDHLGRVRVHYHYGQEGSPLKEVDDLYNGEITVNAIDDPNLNRMAEPHTDQTRDPNDRYMVATIYEGLFGGSGPNRHRNPFSFIDEMVTGALSRALDAGASAEVKPRDAHGKVWEVSWRAPPEAGFRRRRHVVVVDGQRGWVVTSYEEYSLDDDKLDVRTTCEYAPDSNGVWLARSGRWQSWWKKPVNEPPAKEWRFEVDRIVLNDPGFDERVFEVALKPGTFVNDMRFDVAYRVGQEGAVGSELAALAQEAAAKNAANRRRLEPQPVDLSKRRLGTTRPILIGVSALVFVAMLCLWGWRRFGKS